jgi:ribosomal protein L35AE/L33A
LLLLRVFQVTQSALLKIEGATSSADADFYLGKRVAYIYKVRAFFIVNAAW